MKALGVHAGTFGLFTSASEAMAAADYFQAHKQEEYPWFRFLMVRYPLD